MKKKRKWKQSKEGERPERRGKERKTEEQFLIVNNADLSIDLNRSRDRDRAKAGTRGHGWHHSEPGIDEEQRKWEKKLVFIIGQLLKWGEGGIQS
jgi:hypothetical protein